MSQQQQQTNMKVQPKKIVGKAVGMDASLSSKAQKNIMTSWKNKDKQRT